MANGSNDIHIEEWMIKDLQITGTEVMCFAVVYCYSKNGGSYYGGLPSLAERLGMPEVTLGRVIKRLVSKGFLHCAHISKGGRQYCDLRAMKTPIKMIGVPHQNDRCTPSKRQVTPIKTTDKYNNKYNNKDYKENNKDYSSSTTAREEEEFVLDEKAFVQMFNKYVDATNSKIKRLHGLDRERMDKVKYLVEKYGVQEFGEFLCKAMTSKFLNADGNEKWATFDWLINEKNFLKVAEDNYKELYNDNKPNNDGRTNNGLAGEAPQTNAERAGEWATNRIKEIVEKSKRKNQGGVHGELPDGGSNDRFLLPF